MFLFGRGLLGAGLLLAAGGHQCLEPAGAQAEMPATFVAGEQYARVLVPPMVIAGSGMGAWIGEGSMGPADCCLLNSEGQPQAWNPIPWAWSSSPLLMYVQFPMAPEIVAVSGDGTTLGPLRPGEPVTVNGRWLTLKLANVTAGDYVAVYLDGERTAEPPIPTYDVCALRIRVDQPPGVYALTARVLPARHGHRVASLPSREVIIRLRPDHGCAQLVSPPSPEHCKHGEKDGASCSKADGEVLAFSAVPSPQPIPLQNERESEKSKATPSDSEQGGKPPCAHWFASAAHFPVREFGARGEVIGREGAVIYEGMRFSHHGDGHYEVSFLVGTPAVPTTLRLRLLVRVRDVEGPVWQTLTLPPIQIESHKDAAGKDQPAVWRICHQGYSPMLACNPGRIIAVRREGTARFGFGASL